MNYSIGQFSALTRLSTHTLRYYEKEGLLKTLRDAAGRRIYCAADAEWIAFIIRLKETGMPLAKIREYAVLRYAGDSTLQQRLALLEEHRVSVFEAQERLTSNLAKLSAKIELYQKKINSVSLNDA